MRVNPASGATPPRFRNGNLAIRICGITLNSFSSRELPI
jgi:hypothetical protein